jgi:hypothetical protein
MAYVYDVHLSSGRVHQVTTQHHHSEHSEQEFRQIIQRILENATSQVISGSIIRIAFRNRV